MPTLEEGDHKYLLSFGGKTHTLYQHSYLGYGLMRARRSVHNLVGFMWDFRLDGHHATPGSIGSGNDDAEPEIPNPCLSQGTKRKVKLDGGKWSDGFNATMSGADVGSFENCNRVVELVMAKDAYVFTLILMLNDRLHYRQYLPRQTLLFQRCLSTIYVGYLPKWRYPCSFLLLRPHQPSSSLSLISIHILQTIMELEL